MASDKLGVELVVEGLRQYLKDMQRAQMATDRTSRSLEQLDDTATRTQKSVRKSSSSVDKFGDSASRGSINIMGMVRDMRDVAQAFNEVIMAGERIAGAIDQFVGRGVEVGRTRFQFELLAGSAMAASAELEQMRAAVGGTIPDLDLMTTANAALNAGIVETVDELDEFVRIARVVELTSTAGSSAVEELTLAAANMSTKRFDQLGLSLSRFKEIQEEVRQGASNLSKEEIWQESFWQLVTERADQMGSVLDEGVGSGVDQLRTKFVNFTDTIKEEAAEAADFLASAFVTGLDRIGAMLGGADEDFGAFIDDLIIRAERLGVGIAPAIEEAITGPGAAFLRGGADIEVGMALINTAAKEQIEVLEDEVEALENLEAQLPQLRAEQEAMLAVLRESVPQVATAIEANIGFETSIAGQIREIEAVRFAYRAYMQQIRVNQGIYLRNSSLFDNLNATLAEQAVLYERTGRAGAAFANMAAGTEDIYARNNALSGELNMSLAEQEDLYQRAGRAGAAFGEAVIPPDMARRLAALGDVGIVPSLDLVPLEEQADLVNRLFDRYVVVGQAASDANVAFDQVRVSIMGVNEESKGLPVDRVDEFATASERAALAQEGLSQALGITAATGLETDLFGQLETGSEGLDQQLALLFGQTNEAEIAFNDLAISMQDALETGQISEETYLGLAAALGDVLATGEAAARTLSEASRLILQGQGDIANFVLETGTAIEDLTVGGPQFIAGPGAPGAPTAEGPATKGIGALPEIMETAATRAAELRDTLDRPIKTIYDSEALGLDASLNTSISIDDILSAPVTKVVNIAVVGAESVNIPLPASIPGNGEAIGGNGSTTQVNFNGPILGGDDVAAQVRQATQLTV